MSAPRTYTEREMVLAEREAVRRAVSALWFRGLSSFVEGTDWEGADRLAARLFPLPTITRPRVIDDTKGASWQVVNGAIYWQWKTPKSAWIQLGDEYPDAMYLTVERVKILADLLAHPTETVEDDGGDA